MAEWIQPFERQQIYQRSVHFFLLCAMPTVTPRRLCPQKAICHGPEDAYWGGGIFESISRIEKGSVGRGLRMDVGVL